MEGNILLMPFLDESSSFCNGYECGVIWEKMDNDQPFDKHLIHSANIPQIVLMANHFGYQKSFEVIDDTWAYLTAKPIDISALNQSSNK